MKYSDFLETQSNMLHFMHLTKVLLFHPGIQHLETSGMLSIWGKWIASYFLIPLSGWGFPFLISRENSSSLELVSSRWQACACDISFSAKRSLNSRYWEVLFAGCCRAWLSCRYWIHELVMSKSVKWGMVWTDHFLAGHSVEAEHAITHITQFF